MQEQKRSKFITLPVSQHPLAVTLLEEVGNLAKHQFTYADDECCPSRYGFPDAVNHVRTRIRDAVLAERAQRSNRRLYESGESAVFLSNKTIIGADNQNNVIYKGKLDECPDTTVVNELLVEPLYMAYTWHQVTYWKLGDFNKLLEKATKAKYLLLKKAGVLLFSDELVQLQEGKIVTPYHWGGVFGWLMEELDTFAVRNQELYRVQAHLSD